MAVCLRSKAVKQTHIIKTKEQQTKAIQAKKSTLNRIYNHTFAMMEQSKRNENKKRERETLIKLRNALKIKKVGRETVVRLVYVV